MKSYITSIGTAVPDYVYDQNEIAEFMLKHGKFTDIEKRKISTLYKASGIEKRFSVLPDFGNEIKKFSLFETGDPDTAPSVSKGMRIYEKEALPLSLKAIKKCLAKKNFIKEKNHSPDYCQLHRNVCSRN
jgi:predicted naringenin-chalcone synthase